MENGKSTVAVRNILAKRISQHTLADDQKAIILEQMRRAGSLTYTQDVLGKIWAELTSELEAIARINGAANPRMDMLVGMLRL